MAITDDVKVDFLWKKVVYGVTKTDAAGSKSGSNETIASQSPVAGSQIWAQADQIPNTPPVSTTGIVQLYQGANRIATIADGTAASGRTWITGLTDWIAPTNGANYAVKVYVGDPDSGETGRILPDAAGFEFVFDYASGTLHFPNGIPAGAVANGIYVRGYRYVGGKGIGGAGVNIEEIEAEYSGADIASAPAASPYTFTGFFAHAPQSGTVSVEINGCRLKTTERSISGTDLIINMNVLPYKIEAGDIISARYAFAS